MVGMILNAALITSSGWPYQCSCDWLNYRCDINVWWQGLDISVWCQGSDFITNLDHYGPLGEIQEISLVVNPRSPTHRLHFLSPRCGAALGVCLPSAERSTHRSCSTESYSGMINQHQSNWIGKYLFSKEVEEQHVPVVISIPWYWSPYSSKILLPGIWLRL